MSCSKIFRQELPRSRAQILIKNIKVVSSNSTVDNTFSFSIFCLLNVPCNSTEHLKSSNAFVRDDNIMRVKIKKMYLRK